LITSIYINNLTPNYKNNKYSLAIPIHKLFSHSLSKGVFPFQWKNSYVTPIHKSGVKNLVSNYRPITKLSALPKPLVMLMMPWLTFSFKNLINSTQHGFFKGRSAETNLFCFYNAKWNLVPKLM